METERSDGSEAEMEKLIIDMTPLGRLGKPDDIAKVVTFLASDASGWITGDRINVSGGLFFSIYISAEVPKRAFQEADT